MSNSELKGADTFMKRLEQIAGGTPEQCASALFQESQIELTEMKRRTPVETGSLRASGEVSLPEIEGEEISCAITFGGPAASYAVEVHEDLEAIHPVGQAKYAESVLRESAPYFPERVANRIDLAKAAK